MWRQKAEILSLPLFLWIPIACEIPKLATSQVSEKSGPQCTLRYCYTVKNGNLMLLLVGWRGRSWERWRFHQLSHEAWMLGVENNITNTWKCSHLPLFYIKLRLRAKLTVDISRCKSSEVTAVTSTYARGEFVPIFGTCWFCATALAHCIVSKSFWAMALCHWLSNMMHRVKHLPDNGPDLLFDTMHHATVPCPKGIW